jgi:hypothetical protein
MAYSRYKIATFASPLSSDIGMVSHFLGFISVSKVAGYKKCMDQYHVQNSSLHIQFPIH